MQNLSLTILLSCTLVHTSGCANELAREDTRPNILFFFADDLGYSDLSSFDSKHIKTPVLDNLAESGIRLTNFYAGSVVCSPSRAAFLTGRNHNRTGVYTWIPEESPMHLPVDETTIVEVLKKSGYQTAHFGKWHLGNWNEKEKMPIFPSINEYGFDYWYASANNALPSHKNPVNFHLNGVPMGEQEGYAAQLVADQAITWLSEHYRSQQPFYMQLWFNEPHERVAAPEKFRQRHLQNGLTEHEADYYGCIENMDDAIGRVMKKIKEMGIAGETLVIFTSDNGSRFPGSNGILRGQKGQVWEGGIRVPAIFYWEGRISPHWDQDAPCGVIDLFPTFCELTNNENAMSFATDGESLMPIIDNKPFERKKPMFSFHHHNAMASLRENEWNLIGFLYPESPGPSRFRPEHIEYMRTAKLVKYELYNLEKDPGQNNDLSRVFPEIVEKMQKTMKKLYEEVVFEGVDWFSDPYTKTETK